MPESTFEYSTFNQTFWVSRTPVKALYSIDFEIDPSKELLKGEEEVRLINKTSKALSRLIFNWEPGKEWDMKVGLDGNTLKPISKEPMLFELPEPLKPNEDIKLSVNFSFKLPEDRYLKLLNFHPRIWWGYQSHDDFMVKVKRPENYEVLTSGRFDENSGFYMASDVKDFGVVIAKDFLTAEGETGDVKVKVLFTEKGKKCSEPLLETALDAIDFYRGVLGFYPQPILSIIPGVEEPIGGYPFATNMIVIHGQERFEEKPLDFWKWIVAHEIGHQYFGEYVLEGNQPEWLLIGLGIYFDREYSRHRGLSPEIHRRLMLRYIEGVREGLDTTVERPLEQLTAIGFDFNNIVVHGKGFSIISALEVVIGREVFIKVCRRILSEFKGRRLKASKFQEICEEESGQDLDWFFGQWLRTNKYLSYKVDSVECTCHDGHYVTTVRVKRLGSIEMSIPVEARFEDGSSARKMTDRVLPANELKFQSISPIIDARLDPDSLLPLVYPPPKPSEAEVAMEVVKLSWVGSGEKAKEIYEKACEAGLTYGPHWFKLGLTLYDGKFYREGLEAFKKSGELSEETVYIFASTVWQGHICDLLGRRDEALKLYQKAKDMKFKGMIRHDQYGLLIDEKWVEERLKSPFRRTD
jgi:hypothetical protein